MHNFLKQIEIGESSPYFEVRAGVPYFEVRPGWGWGWGCTLPNPMNMYVSSSYSSWLTLDKTSSTLTSIITIVCLLFIALEEATIYSVVKASRRRRGNSSWIHFFQQQQQLRRSSMKKIDSICRWWMGLIVDLTFITHHQKRWLWCFIGDAKTDQVKALLLINESSRWDGIHWGWIDNYCRKLQQHCIIVYRIYTYTVTT